MHTVEEGIELSCFYPMDKHEYEMTIKDRGRNVYFMPHGSQSRFAIANSLQKYGSKRVKHTFMFKFLDNAKIDTVLNGTLAEIYRMGERKMIPLIFCHGLTGNRMTHSGQLRELASHGYCVFTLTHFDGTSNLSKKKDGSRIYWLNEGLLLDFHLRKKQL